MSSLPPISIPDLDPAVTIDRDNDLLLLRQGLNDKKATVAQLAQFELSDYGTLPGSIVESDVLLVGRNTGSGTYQNYLTSLQRIGFYSGVMTWFYSYTAPIGWAIVGKLGDRVLGVGLSEINPGEEYKYSRVEGAPQKQGTWQQPGVSLSITQIPNHQHWGQFGRNLSEEDPSYIHGALNKPYKGNPRYGKDTILGIVGGKNDNDSHNNYGGCDPHNHGAKWRPAAVIGVVCKKTA